jgi:hypothetical protein
MRRCPWYVLAFAAFCVASGCSEVRVERPRAARATQPADAALSAVYATPHDAARALAGVTTVDANVPAWRRMNRYYYYASCDVYHSPLRSRYIWRGPRGWVISLKPPATVVLMPDEAVTVELGSESDPAGSAGAAASTAQANPPPPDGSREEPAPRPSTRDPARDRAMDLLPDKYRPAAPAGRPRGTGTRSP